MATLATALMLEKSYTDSHLNRNAHPIYLYSCHSIPCYKLLEAHFNFRYQNDNNIKQTKF